MEMTLWVNRGNGMGRKSATVLRFELDQPIPARDFTLDDVALKLTDYRLLINGEARSGD